MKKKFSTWKQRTREGRSVYSKLVVLMVPVFLSPYMFWWYLPTLTLGLTKGLILANETNNKFDTIRNLNNHLYISTSSFPPQPSQFEDKTCGVESNHLSSDVPVMIQHVGGPNQDHQRFPVYIQLNARVWVRPQSPTQINRNSQPPSIFMGEKKCFLLCVNEVL